jgi:hypothetical protein
MNISPELIDIIVCPKCQKSVSLQPDGKCLICYNCGLAYPIDDDIPVMLVDSAIRIDS